MHHASPYQHRRWDYGTTIAVNMERSLLEVPVQTVIRAGQNLNPNCPLHALVCGYLEGLARTARDSPASVAAVAATTTHLVRAIICAAAGDDGYRESLNASLFQRIRLYIDAHLIDPELNSEGVAAAHHISVRHLYTVWRSEASVDLSLANWIMSKRLELAADRLSNGASRHLTVGMVGRACGFVDPTHFCRRFRAKYGMTPREWRLARR
ncbi:hypothetical protein BH09ACT7_BH09ACT7_07200 [soil metagenome]